MYQGCFHPGRYMGYDKTKGDIETDDKRKTYDQDNGEPARMASKIPNKGPFKWFGKKLYCKMVRRHWLISL